MLSDSPRASMEEPPTRPVIDCGFWHLCQPSRLNYGEQWGNFSGPMWISESSFEFPGRQGGKIRNWFAGHFGDIWGRLGSIQDVPEPPTFSD